VKNKNLSQWRKIVALEKIQEDMSVCLCCEQQASFVMPFQHFFLLDLGASNFKAFLIF